MNQQTQNRLQEIIDTFNFTFDNFYKIADNKTKSRVNIYVEEWKEKDLLKGYFGVLANNIYRRTRVKNSEILELLIYSAYIDEQNELDKHEKKIMYEEVNYYYKQGQEEVNSTLPKNKRKKVSIIPDAIFLDLLDTPNSKGYIWRQYIEAITRYNAEQIYRQITIDLQQQNKPDIMNDIYQNIIKKQQNSKLNINNNKISGDIDITLIGLNNMAKVEGIRKCDSKARCQFISDKCENVTMMCSNMDGMIFKINDWNEFDRWYGETIKGLRLERIKIKGLVLGVNLPPIRHHFHWCHSYIIYVENGDTINKDYLDDEDLLQYSNISNYIKKDITKQKNILIEKAFKNDIIKKIALDNDIKKVYIYGKKTKHKANKIYLNAEWNNKRQNVKDRTLRHEVGHAIDYKYNYISCTGELSTALEIDKINILKEKYKISNLLKSKEYQEYAELSDMLGGLTNNQIVGKYKHSNEYWKRKNSLEKETFANLFAIAGGNDIKYLKVINEYLPNTLKAFDYLIRRLK